MSHVNLSPTLELTGAVNTMTLSLTIGATGIDYLVELTGTLVAGVP